MLEGRIETLNINQIKPYWRNPRINEKAVAAVARSIEQFGYNSPIVVDKDFVIIAGHARFKALKQLDFNDVRVVVADGLDAEKAKQYRIADNKTGEIAEWDSEALIKELRETNIPDMEIFFPDLNLVDLIAESTGTIKWNDVTDASFKKSVELEAGKIDAISEKRAAERREVTCPHCGEDFTIL